MRFLNFYLKKMLIVCIEKITSFIIKKEGKESRKIVIMTKSHTLYIANSLKFILEKNGYLVYIEININRVYFPHALYIVICPQTFKYLPTSNKRISFQLEQYTSNWFSPTYLSILKESKAVWDYSLKNLDFLVSKGVLEESISYTPISGIVDYKIFLKNEYAYYFENKKTIDILFYGDLSSKRRKDLLNPLSERFNVKVATNVYGFDILNLINQSKIVINLHYYENALLETTRIFECLSLGSRVLTEYSIDRQEYKFLENSPQIYFFETGDVQAMLRGAEKMLSNNDTYFDKQLIKDTQNILEHNILISLKKINF